MLGTRFLAAAVVAFGVAGAAVAAPVSPTFDTFGTLSGATFGGSGIPDDAVAITQVTIGSDIITLGLTAHQRFFNPALSNDGAGTFNAGSGANFGGPGSSSTDLGALWNFAFYIDIDGDAVLADFEFELLYDFDPGADTDEPALGSININGAIAGLGGDPGLLQRAESSQNLLFPFLATSFAGVVTPPAGSFDPDASGEYSFVLRVSEPGGELGRSAINVTVPEPGTMAVLGVALVGLGLFRIRRKASLTA